MADHDGGAQHGHRHPAEAEQLLDVPPGAQVRRQVVVEVAEAAEVDDLPDAGVGGGVPEGGRGLGVPLLEVVRVQGVHQVVGGVARRPGRARRLSASATSPYTGSPAPS